MVMSTYKELFVRKLVQMYDLNILMKSLFRELKVLNACLVLPVSYFLCGVILFDLHAGAEADILYVS